MKTILSLAGKKRSFAPSLHSEFTLSPTIPLSLLELMNQAYLMEHEGNKRITDEMTEL